MARASDASDEEIEARLRTLYQSTLERAHQDVAGLPITVGAHRRTATLAQLAMIAALAVVGLFIGIPLIGGGPGNQGGAFSPSMIATPSPPEPTVSPEASPVLRNGIPVHISGEEVLTGTAALSALQESTDDRTILIGGWLHGGDQAMSCPLNPGPWNPCIAIQLYGERAGGVAMFVYPGPSKPTIPAPPSGQAQAIVMRVHTHDSRCVPDGSDCNRLPVLDQIVWLGTSAAATGSAAGVTAPPGGVSRAGAIAAAEGYLAARVSSSAALRSATLGQYGAVGGGGAAADANRWVWASYSMVRFNPPRARLLPG